MSDNIVAIYGDVPELVEKTEARNHITIFRKVIEMTLTL